MFNFSFRTAITGCLERAAAFVVTKRATVAPVSVLARTWTWTDVSVVFMGPVEGWAGVATGPSAASISLSGARRALPPVHFTTQIPGIRFPNESSPVCASGCDPRGRNLTGTRTKLRSLLDAHREACGTSWVKTEGELWVEMMNNLWAELDKPVESAWYDQ